MAFFLFQTPVLFLPSSSFLAKFETFDFVFFSNPKSLNGKSGDLGPHAPNPAEWDIIEEKEYVEENTNSAPACPLSSDHVGYRDAMPVCITPTSITTCSHLHQSLGFTLQYFITHLLCNIQLQARVRQLVP